MDIPTDEIKDWSSVTATMKNAQAAQNQVNIFGPCSYGLVFARVVSQAGK